MNSGFPNSPHGFQGQGSLLLHSNSFSIVPGHGGDGSKYVVKDQGAGGSPLLWVLDVNHGNPSVPTLLVAKDAGQMDVLRVSRNIGTPMVTLLDASGNQIGSVLISSKDIKEYKKDKDSKDKKRQIVLQNSMNQPLLLMSGKGNKRSDGSVEMKIKSMSSSKLTGASSYPTDPKHKDKKDKDKKDKDKDKKDKDKKNKKELGEVTGSLTNGFHVKVLSSNVTLPEKINVIGLLIAYMELEKTGTQAQHGANPAMAAYPYPQGGMPYPQQQPQPHGYPGPQYVPPGGVGQYPPMGTHMPQQMGFPGQAPAPGYAPFPGQAPGYAPFPGQAPGSAPFLGQAPGYAPFPGQAPGSAPFPGQGQHYHQPNY